MPGVTENNHMWKGDKVGYKSLHEWVAIHKGRPSECSKCNKHGSVDLANISGEYKRDLSDWEWLCRKCHMEKDGRLERFLSHSKKRKLDSRLCLYCSKAFKPKDRHVKFCSRSCATTYNNIAGKLGSKSRVVKARRDEVAKLLLG